MTDEEILTRFAAGDEAALGELASRYERLLLGLAQGILGGRDDLARDAVQEAWMRVIRSAGSFKGRSTVKTWLYRITINRCRTMRLMRKREMDRKTAAHALPPVESTTENGFDTGALREAIDQLGPDKREIVLLCYHADLTHEQAATILNIPLGTLKSRLHAALKFLRSTLSPEVCT